MFAALECAQLMTVPACPRCGGTDWRDEVDELTAPDHRDGGERA
jgi:RNA polymerase subunit RPABC4/transcription elongation factor Spt4